jgi:hypothetical protein
MRPERTFEELLQPTAFGRLPSVKKKMNERLLLERAVIKSRFLELANSPGRQASDSCRPGVTIRIGGL